MTRKAIKLLGGPHDGHISLVDHGTLRVVRGELPRVLVYSESVRELPGHAPAIFEYDGSFADFDEAIRLLRPS